MPFKIDPSRFSKWRKVVGAVAYVLRDFLPNELKPSSEVLLENELERARKFVILQTQAEIYAKELIALKRGKSHRQKQ